MDYEILVQGFRTPNLVNKYTTVLVGKPEKPWKFPKAVLLYWTFLKIYFDVHQKPK